MNHNDIRYCIDLMFPKCQTSSNVGECVSRKFDKLVADCVNKRMSTIQRVKHLNQQYQQEKMKQ